jgi:hypothetical protein
MKKIQKHYNKVQLESLLVGAPYEDVVAGRGMGKTTRILAPAITGRFLNTMPRSSGVILAATYTQAFTRTLPELIKGLQELGYEYGNHFLIGTTPTEEWKRKWKWKGPFAPPLTYKYFFSWYNGAGAHVISQERAGSTNGLSIDWIAGDEKKLLNEEKIRTETMPANRGIIKEFVGNPYHHGWIFTTDMPVGSSGRWILDQAKKCDTKKVAEVLKLQAIIYQLKNGISKKTNQKGKREIEKQIAILQEEILNLRKNLYYYHEGSTISNIHALGADYILQQLRDTTQFQFDTQILNLKTTVSETLFYPDFDCDVHGYIAESSDYFDSLYIDPLNPVFDCRKDKLWDTNKPIHIANDYNKSIYTMIVAQVYADEIRIDNAMHVLYPLKIKDLIASFANYYRYTKNKHVYYWFDHTAVGEQRETTLSEDVVRVLSQHGFIVHKMYIGRSSSHKDRYEYTGSLFKNDGKYKRKVRVNLDNCTNLVISIETAATKQGKDGYQKDKDNELDPKFPQQEATHYSEAFDTLIDGVLNKNLFI